MVKASAVAQQPPESVNALARQAMERIREIDRKAAEEKDQQIQILRHAKDAVHQRVVELLHQEDELDKAIAHITGAVAAKVSAAKRPRANYADILDRLVGWLQAHKGQRYTYRQLETELPELTDVSFAQLIKPAVAQGEITKEGNHGSMTYGAA